MLGTRKERTVMAHVGMWLLIGALAIAIGFSVLQRRDPADADKVASSADGLWKRLVQSLKNRIHKGA
jgi:hypothetical protein